MHARVQVSEDNPGYQSSRSSFVGYCTHQVRGTVLVCSFVVTLKYYAPKQLGEKDLTGYSFTTKGSQGTQRRHLEAGTRQRPHYTEYLSECRNTSRTLDVYTYSLTLALGCCPCSMALETRAAAKGRDCSKGGI